LDPAASGTSQAAELEIARLEEKRETEKESSPAKRKELISGERFNRPRKLLGLMPAHRLSALRVA
jgi:hypothetical protein